MATKKSTGVGVVTERGAHAALRRSPTKDLSPEEEQVVRMRLGASVPRTAPLERSYDADSDLEIEIRAAEIEAWMKAKARAADRAAERVGIRSPTPAPSRVKEKIVRALRRKG
jgi:hypothetical protein